MTKPLLTKPILPKPMKFDIITAEIWQSSEMGSPELLCQLPFNISEIEGMLDVQFEKVIDDGLATVFYAYISLDEQQVLLKGYVNRQIKQDFAVCTYMHSDARNPTELLNTLTLTLGIDKSQLLGLGKHLDIPKYILSRVDDNGNEIEINRFHDRRVAEYLRKKFQDRGHKQDYYVHAALCPLPKLAF